MKKYVPNLFLIFLLGYLLLLIKPSWTGELRGTFKTTEIPAEYTAFSNFMSSQKSFSRVFWVPQNQRFTYYSSSHPAVSAGNYFNISDYSQVLKKLRTSEMKKILQESSVKHVIIPYDSEGEIFLKDRKYNERLYLQIVKDISSIEWLKKIDGFGKIAVFEVSSPKDHFWSPSDSIKISYKYINPTKYEVIVKNAKKNDIVVFSESYDRYWIAQNSEFKIQSSEFHDRFNSFVLPKEGNYDLRIYYTPQDWVNIGVGISMTALILILGFLGFGLISRK